MVPPSERKFGKKSVKNGTFFIDFQKISPAASYILTKHIGFSYVARKNMNFLLHFCNERKNERYWARFQLKSKKREEKFALIKNPSIFGRLLNYEKKFRKNLVWSPPPRKFGIFREKKFLGGGGDHTTICTVPHEPVILT